MLGLYFKQAWQMIRQNRFISVVSIVGTALAIMLVMVIVVVDRIKSGDVRPEVNRSRTVYITGESRVNEESNSSMNHYVSSGAVDQFFYELKVPELISAYLPADSDDGAVVRTDFTKGRIYMPLATTDDVYWKILSYDFTAGRPYTRDEFEAGAKVAVLSESGSRKLFGKSDPVGAKLQISMSEYTVVGVVRDVPESFSVSFSEIWIPYTSKADYRRNGVFNVMCLLESTDDMEALDVEIREAERIASENEEEGWKIYFRGPFFTYRSQQSFLSNSWRTTDHYYLRMFGFLFMVLLIPAINLSSFGMSRIKQRMEEIGIRKAFGAKRGTILTQVLCENLLTSLIGAVIGLILSYAAVLLYRNWLLGAGSISAIPFKALVSPGVLFSVLGAAVLINVLSAGIPAYRASRMKITDSLNRNKF